MRFKKNHRANTKYIKFPQRICFGFAAWKEQGNLNGLSRVSRKTVSNRFRCDGKFEPLI